MELWIVWLIILFLLAFVEASTTNLVAIWFIASGLISLILSFFEIAFLWQFATFVLLGLLLMITTKPILKKWLKPKNIKINLDRVIGMTGIVTSEISKNIVGEVKVDGKKWSAISTKKIKIDEEVMIDSIDGVKLNVHKLENQ